MLQEKQIKEVEVVVESYTECDRCKQRIENDYYDAFECTFEHKTGSIYPSGGSGKLENFDLCKSCAVIVVKLLEDNGIRINRSDWDY